jgi:hypothetical protein
MQRIKALYVAGAIGVAAAAVAVPIVVRRLANFWPSPEIAPGRTAGAVPVSSPPVSASAQPNPPVPALPTLASPALISPETVPTSSAKNEPRPDAASGNSEPKKPAAASSTAAEAAVGRPAFDVVRVDPTGETVVAGHAAPKAVVELRDGGRVIAKVVADEAGQFVILPPPLPSGSHRLELAASDGGPSTVVSDPVTVEVAAQKPRHSALPQPPAPTAAPLPKTIGAPAEADSELHVAARPDDDGTLVSEVNRAPVVAF